MITVTSSGQRMIPVSKEAAKRTIKAFEHAGSSNHSSNAATLPIVVEHCERNKIPYRLTAVPGLGYFIEKFDAIK